MRECIDARHLFARCAGLLLPVVGHDLRQWSLQRRGWRGIVLHERLCGWGDTVSVEQQPSDMRRRGQRLHRLHHHRNLLDRAGLRALRPRSVRGSKLGGVADAQ
jgi:hypothetical protein